MMKKLCSIIKAGVNFSSEKRRLEAWELDFSGLTPQATPQATPQVISVLGILSEREKSAFELMSELGLTDRKYFRSAYLEPAMTAGLVLPKYPDKPTHPDQKYHITELGLEVLNRK